MNDNQDALVESIKAKLKSSASKKFVFLLVGRTGMGKSSTINTLMGQEIAPVGDYDPTTLEVKHYDSELYGVQYRIVDTPGLCDDLPERGNDDRYLEMMRSAVAEKIDCMWFLTRLDETRVTGDEKRGIKFISEAFGEKVWGNSVIVFTFAGNVPKDKYANALAKRTELIRIEIAKHAGDAIANQVPSTAVDNKFVTTPDGQPWLGELYAKVLSRISGQGAFSFFLATSGRLRKLHEVQLTNAPSVSSSGARYIDLNERQTREVRKALDASIITMFAAAGAGIGEVLGPVGAAVGGVLGAAIGVYVWLKS